MTVLCLRAHLFELNVVSLDAVDDICEQHAHILAHSHVCDDCIRIQESEQDDEYCSSSARQQLHTASEVERSQNTSSAEKLADFATMNLRLKQVELSHNKLCTFLDSILLLVPVGRLQLEA
jgi:recombinational DNA repair protein RecR